jgi:hypothetical protein
MQTWIHSRKQLHRNAMRRLRRLFSRYARCTVNPAAKAGALTIVGEIAINLLASHRVRRLATFSKMETLDTPKQFLLKIPSATLVQAETLDEHLRPP